MTLTSFASYLLSGSFILTSAKDKKTKMSFNTI